MSVSILHDFYCIDTSDFSYICIMFLLHLYFISLLYLYSISFFFLHKKCTEGHLPCTNGIVLIQKAGMKRCGQRAALADRREPLAPNALRWQTGGSRWLPPDCPHSLPTTPFPPAFFTAFYSGSMISVTNTPGSFCRLMYPPYFSTTRLIRFNPCP